MPLKKRIAKVLDSLGLLKVAYDFYSQFRNGTASRTISQFFKSRMIRWRTRLSTLGRTHSIIRSARILLTQGNEAQGLAALAIHAYGPNVRAGLRRTALAELLTWGLTANDPAITEAAGNHLAGGFGSRNFRGNRRAELTLLLEHFSVDGHWSQPDAYKAFIRATRRPRLRQDYATANFAFAMPADLLGALAVHQLQVAWSNYILSSYSLVGFATQDDATEPLVIDDLNELIAHTNQVNDGPKVSVIIPVFNGEEYLPTALQSLVNQTWRNLEILVVDDKSTDGTRELVAAWSKRDSRIKLIAAKSNGGSYRARNVALDEATGDFVTVQDADDWSHPQKIEIQAQHLVRHRSRIANISQGLRIRDDRVHFYPVIGKHYLRKNISSMMFRRKPVAEALGYWDEVRFGADSEFHERMAAKFGSDRIAVLNAGPLSFNRLHAASLTGSGYSSTQKGISGIRLYYSDAYKIWHKEIARKKANAYLGRESKGRPFNVPALHQDRKAKLAKFDIVIAANLGATSKHLATVKQVIAANKSRIALLHTLDPNYPEANVAPSILKLLDFDRVTLLLAGDVASTKILRVLDARMFDVDSVNRAKVTADKTVYGEVS